MPKCLSKQKDAKQKKDLENWNFILKQEKSPMKSNFTKTQKKSHIGWIVTECIVFINYYCFLVTIEYTIKYSLFGKKYIHCINIDYMAISHLLKLKTNKSIRLAGNTTYLHEY